jgi:hypothetical protein
LFSDNFGARGVASCSEADGGDSSGEFETKPLDFPKFGGVKKEKAACKRTPANFEHL